MMNIIKTSLNRIILIVFVLSALGILEAASPDTLKVLHLTDTHICNLTGYHPGFVKLREHYGNGIKPLRHFLKTAPTRYDADIMIITGDLIDFFDAETVGGEMLETQIEQFVPLYFECPIPLYVTLGNHDIRSYWFEEPDQKKYISYLAACARATWIRNIPCFQRGTYYMRSFPVGQTTYRFIFLDNGYYLCNGSFIDKTQLDWLNYQLQQVGDHPVLIFMHVYLPVPDLNDDGVLFSPEKTVLINETTCSDGFLKVLNENPNIKALIAGHGHKNIIEAIDFPNGHQIIQTETAAFGRDTANWRMLKFTEHHIIIMQGGDDQTPLVIPVM